MCSHKQVTSRTAKFCVEWTWNPKKTMVNFAGSLSDDHTIHRCWLKLLSLLWLLSSICRKRFVCFEVSVTLLHLMWIYLWDPVTTAYLLMHANTCPVTFYPLLPVTDRRGLGGNGRDHYITNPPEATVLSNCHTKLPQRCLQARGQVLCATLQIQGGRERIEGGKCRGKDKYIKLCDKDVAAFCLAPGFKSQLLSCGNTWHFCFHDPDNVCVNMERWHKVKGHASMVVVSLVIATSEVFYTREAGICVFMR